MTPETAGLTGDVTAVPAEVTCATVEDTGAVTLAALPVSEDVTVPPVETAWLAADDTEPLAEETELASAEVAGWPPEPTCPAADDSVPVLLEGPDPTACVVADAVEVTAEFGEALVDAAVLAAETLPAAVGSLSAEAVV